MVIAESLRGAAPDDLDAVRTLALARRRRADVLALTGAKAEALVDLEKSSQLYLGAAAGPQASLDDKLEAGIAHVKLGDLLGNPNFENLGRGTTPAASMPRRWPCFSAPAAEEHDPWRMRRFLGLTLERVGTLHEDAGEWRAAQESYEASYEVRRALATEQGSHRDIVRDLGIALEKLGNVRRAQAGAAAAVPAIAKHSPSSSAWRASIPATPTLRARWPSAARSWGTPFVKPETGPRPWQCWRRPSPHIATWWRWTPATCAPRAISPGWRKP